MTPFSENRFENVRQNLFFLTGEMLTRLDRSRSLVLIGARGTGKTTLLQALNWEERFSNPHLREALPQNPFQTSHGQLFGTYQKVSKKAFGTVEAWADRVGDPAADPLRGRYLEAVWSEGLFRAISDGLAHRLFDLSADQEQDLVGELVKGWRHAFTMMERLNPVTYSQLAQVLQLTRQSYEAAATRMKPPEEVWRDLGEPSHTGEFLRDAARQFSEASSGASDPQWYFKVCLDEAETFSRRFKLILNGLIRVAEWPLFYVVSYAQLPEEVLETDLEGLSILPGVDVDIVRLDRSETLTPELGVPFEKYVEGVADVRIRFMRGGSKKSGGGFSVRRFAGSLNVNEILQRILGGRSVSKEGRGLLARAREMDKHPFFQDYETRDAVAGPEPPPPIYQTFLVETLGLELPTAENPDWERRRQGSAEIRSRMVAAYMAICDTIGVEIEYSSADMLLSLCDGCIRDFLNFADGVYDAGGCSLKNVDSRTVPAAAQARALRAVSDRKTTGIRSRPVKYVREIENLVRGLGLFTAALQREAPNLAHLKSPERGNVRLPIRERELPYLTKARNVILQAAEWGYLTILEETDEHLKVRVHTSLAPAFGFSYRGAYHDAPLHWREVLSLLECETPAQVEALVVEWRDVRDEAQQSLPLF